VNADLIWSVNYAEAKILTKLLVQCDRDYKPPLSSRVELPDYAEQLCRKAERLEAWEKGELVGCIAIYCNAADRARAFVSNVCIAPEYRGRGIAAQLMQDALDLAAKFGFERVRLEVDAEARLALKLYRKLGFEMIASEGDTQTWEREIVDNIHDG